MENRLAYYPGCSLHGMAREYDVSMRTVCSDLGIDLFELEDWSCCGSSSAHAQNHLLSLALPARNLALAERAGCDVLAPCAACFSRLQSAYNTMAEGGQAAELVADTIGIPVAGTSKPLSLPQVLAPLSDAIAERTCRPLSHLRVACYYGCLLVRTEGAIVDDPENPTVLERLLEQTGATTVEWSHKTECCGAFLSVPRTDIVARMTSRILAAAKQAGANCIAVACPMCQSNLDMRQKAAEIQAGEQYNLPIFYITQLLGLAFGHSDTEMGLDKLLVDGRSLVSGGVA